MLWSAQTKYFHRPLHVAFILASIFVYIVGAGFSVYMNYKLDYKLVYEAVSYTLYSKR